jgi:hypothetical protein
MRPVRKYRVPGDLAQLVEPGIVLDERNRALKPHGLFFPVDTSTASRPTISGMVTWHLRPPQALLYSSNRA